MLVAAVVAGLLVTVRHAFSTPSPPVPSRLVRAGDSKTACVYVGNAPWPSDLAAAERATGVEYGCVEGFANADPTWADWVNPWLIHRGTGWPKWLASSPATHTVILTINLIPDSVSNDADPAAWEIPCDRGAFDDHARALAENLVESGFARVVIRLGPEANGPWENDFVGTTSAEQADWAACFAKEVRTMRTVAGQHFLFDWNVNACYEGIPLAAYYPGNAYVDITGIDVFDISCLTTEQPASWSDITTEPIGLDAFRDFADAHHKPMSIPEWGLQSATKTDDATYVRGIGEFVAQNDVAFESYYDANDDGIVPMGGEVPRSLATYRRMFRS
ncbi:MAG TPA: glycosyl hydrolase [Acidimicrobiales bacterium]|nr:glycosyl hydrolase [Acidimicrobiales bacterium]